MTVKINHQTSVVRTDRGLSVAGTRITLYQIMDYLKAGWTPELIRQWLDMTGKQITDVMNYINTYRNEVEDEYLSVLQLAEENRNYWEKKNKEQFARIAESHSDNQDPVWLKIQVRKSELGMT